MDKHVRRNEPDRYQGGRFPNLNFNGLTLREIRRRIRRLRGEDEEPEGGDDVGRDGDGFAGDD